MWAFSAGGTEKMNVEPFAAEGMFMPEDQAAFRVDEFMCPSAFMRGLTQC